MNPGGVVAISRWLRAATPPVTQWQRIDPAGVAAELASAPFNAADVRCDPSGVGENDW